MWTLPPSLRQILVEPAEPLMMEDPSWTFQYASEEQERFKFDELTASDALLLVQQGRCQVPPRSRLRRRRHRGRKALEQSCPRCAERLRGLKTPPTPRTRPSSGHS